MATGLEGHFLGTLTTTPALHLQSRGLRGLSLYGYILGFAMVVNLLYDLHRVKVKLLLVFQQELNPLLEECMFLVFFQVLHL